MKELLPKEVLEMPMYSKEYSSSSLSSDFLFTFINSLSISFNVFSEIYVACLSKVIWKFIHFLFTIKVVYNEFQINDHNKKI